jgi:hypothetical protein
MKHVWTFFTEFRFTSAYEHAHTQINSKMGQLSRYIDRGYGLNVQGSIPSRSKTSLFFITYTPPLVPILPPVPLQLGIMDCFPRGKAAGV